MSNELLTERCQLVIGLSASNDLYNGDPATDVVNMRAYSRATFLLHQKTSGSPHGTATITVEACSSAAGSSATAIPFKYRKKTTGASSVWGAITAVAATGVSTTANEDTIYEITIQDTDLPEAKKYCRAVFTEVVDSPVYGACSILLEGGRYKDPNLVNSLV